jgi:hypothetical protein
LKPVFIIAIVAVAMIGMMVPSVFAQAHNACIDDMDTDWKISFTFEMIMDGQPAEVQPNIGITEECQRAIYTLSNDGTVYAEWIENPNFELGHFLYISKFPIRDMEESKTEVYVNDRLAENGLKTPLQDKSHYKTVFTTKYYAASNEMIVNTITATALEGGNIISLNGLTTIDGTVSMIIFNDNSEIIYLDQLTPDANGEFSNEILVGGPYWKDGMLEIRVHPNENDCENCVTVYVEIINGMTAETYTSDSSILSTQSNETVEQTIPEEALAKIEAEQRAAEARAEAAIRASESKAAQDLTNLLIIGGITIMIISLVVVLVKRKNQKSNTPPPVSPPPPTPPTNTEASTVFFYECPKCHSGDIGNNPDGSVNCPSCGYRS